MGREAVMSPLGLYQWDNTIFDLMSIPEALNKQTLVDNLLAETAELEVLYPNPTVLKNLVGVWSAKQLDIWNRLYETTQYEYNPIENYDRYETGSENSSNSATHSGNDTHADKRTHTGKDTVNEESKSGHYIAAFDSVASGNNDGLVKQTRDESENEISTTYGSTENSEGNYYYGHKIDNSAEGEHELHIHGNIGVTTSDRKSVV